MNIQEQHRTVLSNRDALTKIAPEQSARFDALSKSISDVAVAIDIANAAPAEVQAAYKNMIRDLNSLGSVIPGASVALDGQGNVMYGTPGTLDSHGRVIPSTPGTIDHQGQVVSGTQVAPGTVYNQGRPVQYTDSQGRVAPRTAVQ
jgi:hypothetical protein